jgi:hypothetical protein
VIAVIAVLVNLITASSGPTFSRMAPTGPLYTKFKPIKPPVVVGVTVPRLVEVTTPVIGSVTSTLTVMTPPVRTDGAEVWKNKNPPMLEPAGRTNGVAVVSPALNVDNGPAAIGADIGVKD